MTSWGEMVFFPPIRARSFELMGKKKLVSRSGAAGHLNPYSVRMLESNVLRSNIAHEDRRALVHRQQRILLDLRVGRQDAFRQAGDHRFRQREVLSRRSVSESSQITKNRKHTSTPRPSFSLCAFAGAGAGSAPSSGGLEAVLFRGGMVAYDVSFLSEQVSFCPRRRPHKRRQRWRGKRIQWAERAANT